ncbi:pyridoxamine 5'-phosphate oxidase family protein [Actinoallomurus acanthiterrae]
MKTDVGESPAFDRAQCLTLVKSVPIGRVVYTHQALPAVMPVNFVLDGEMVIIRTGSDSTLAAAALGTVVAFEVDHLHRDTLNGWWVTVTGHAQLLDDPADDTHAGFGLRPWTQAPNARFIGISSQYITGGRFDLTHIDPLDEPVTRTGT